MRHLSVEPPPFFHRGLSPLARLALFGVLSLALLFADTRFRYLENIRQVVATVLYPLQRATLLPGEAFGFVGAYFASKRSLSEEVLALRQRIVDEAPAVQGYARIRDENARLQAVLDMRSRHEGAATAAEVLYTSRDPFAQKVYINKGIDAGILAGEAVIDADGVIGQVTRVFPYMAEVTLVTDKDHAVPVRVDRSGVRSVLYGSGTGRPPELRFLSPNTDIQVGDILSTSGIDGTYPAGLAVARVTSVERETGQMFARIAGEPVGGVDRSRLVIVLGAVAAQTQRPEEPSGADAARKGGKSRARR